MGVPAEIDTVRFGEEHLLFQTDLELLIHKDPHFALALAFKLVPKAVPRLYEAFTESRSSYIKACHRLHEQIGHECTETAACPIGH